MSKTQYIIAGASPDIIAAFNPSTLPGLKAWWDAALGVTPGASNPGTPVESPLDIPGCVLWLRADLGITKDSENKVSRWEDQSGEENHFTATNCPIWIEDGAWGRPTLNFNGLTNFMTAANSDSLKIHDAATIVVVVEPAPSLSVDRTIIWREVALGGISWLYGYKPYPPGQFSQRFYNGLQYISGISVCINNQPSILSAQKVESGVSWRKDGEGNSGANCFDFGTDDGGTYIGKSTTYSGGDIAGFYGKISEIIVYHGSLTPEQRYNVEAYAMARYNKSWVKVASWTDQKNSLDLVMTALPDRRPLTYSGSSIAGKRAVQFGIPSLIRRLTLTDPSGIVTQMFNGIIHGGTPPTYGPEVNFIHTDYGSEIDEISDAVHITRGEAKAIYNSVTESEYTEYTSPADTEWNADGWTNLYNIKTRSYDTLYETLGGSIGDNILDAELILHIISEDRYFKVMFSDWTGGGGGGFTYDRTEILDPGTPGTPTPSTATIFFVNKYTNYQDVGLRPIAAWYKPSDSTTILRLMIYNVSPLNWLREYFHVATGGSSNADTGDFNGVIDEAYLNEIVINEGIVTWYRNGIVMLEMVRTIGALGVTNFTVGWDGFSSAGAAMELFEMIICQGIVPDVERLQTRSYLKEKYGITF